jgi:hypothetical protein
MTDVVERIVDENLGVYRASPSRLQEDVSQEAQVAGDYRGRLVYELLQNADDAMADTRGTEDRARFVVTDDELWIANTGRALTEADVRGLCGLGASSKVGSSGDRRASIGHKGLGFKSVLEITSEPEVFSTSYCFRLGAEHARRHIEQLRGLLDLPDEPVVPVMRFPETIDEVPQMWDSLAATGFNTAFRFPFRSGLDDDRRVAMADALLALPLTTILFLKHLEQVEVAVELRDRRASGSWRVCRERRSGDQWEPADGLTSSGSYRVVVNSPAESATFLVAHDADVAIGANRVGLAGPAWEGVELTEVSVATPEPGSTALPDAWRRFHVFLPTEEPCESSILVNGAFSTDLSRQQVRVGADPGDYNSHLVDEAARLFVDTLLPVLEMSGVGDVLAALDRGAASGSTAGTSAAGMFHSSLCRRLEHRPLLPAEQGDPIPLGSAVTPPTFLGADGAAFREVLGADATWEGRRFPDADFCDGRWGAVCVDHGAMNLAAGDSLRVLATLADPERSRVVDDPTGGFEVDPVLSLCEEVWRSCPPTERSQVEAAARTSRLFPVARGDDRSVTRVTLEGDTAFYPPRSARLDLPMPGLRFMAHSLCWGALGQNERQGALGPRMRVWGNLFEIKDFRFEEVARAAITPALTLDPGPAARELLASLRDIDTLAAICQLAGRFAKPDRPLRYQRLQSDRALFRLSRLPVPCRPATEGGDVDWVPAYRVYFGADWVGDDSIERILDTLPVEVADRLGVRFLAPPGLFLRRLDGVRPESGTPDAAADDEVSDDEVSDDEDADAPLEMDEASQWFAFLSWIGVNAALRLVHFHDVEENGPTWVRTQDLARPRTPRFDRLEPVWGEYRESLQSAVRARTGAGSTLVPYLYDVHDLEHLDVFLQHAAAEDVPRVASAVFGHLARHWSWYSGFTEAQLALVERGRSPGQRSDPPRAKPEELARVGTNLWLHRLRHGSVCPTTRGPRRPDRSWFPTSELQRRFSSAGRDATDLLPVLSAVEGVSDHRARSVALALGVRTEINPTTFAVQDANLLCRRLEHIYTVDGRDLDATALRDVIRPVYRQLFELLSGRSTAGNDGALAGTPLLAETTAGLRFAPSDQILFSRTPGFRERLALNGAVATFVLEADPSSFAPLGRLFKSRALEDALEWGVDPGSVPFADADLAEFRDRLADLALPLLARIRVERNESGDERVLRDFLRTVTPADHITVSCQLGEEVITRGQERSYFVRPAKGSQTLQAFVVWKDAEPWPPGAESASNLAMALADALGMNLVEAFLAFFQTDEDQHRRLLAIAGASDLLAQVEAEADRGSDEPEAAAPLPPTSDPESPDEHPETGSATMSGSAPAAPPVPLRRFEDLTINGTAVLVSGGTGPGPGQAEDAAARGEAGPSTEQAPSETGSGATHPPPRAAAGTDLAALDRLGMQVAIAYEVLRLRNLGHRDAALLGASPEPGDSFVVDAHSPATIAAAESASPLVAGLLRELEKQGVSRVYPGCDLITIRAGVIDRMIELKSSLTDARVQEMSWNEWKTATHSGLRAKFWLYLVGNLRADIERPPFVRAINDPFGALAAAERTDSQVRRRVQLRVQEFDHAEHLELGTADDGDHHRDDPPALTGDEGASD